MNALPNDAHFQTLYQVAQLQVQDEKYADALATIDAWEKGTDTTTADELALKANAYYRTEKFQDAVDTMKKAVSMTEKPNDSWTQILMASYFELNQYDQAAALVQTQMQKDPGNKKLLNQLATIYIQANKPQQALDLMAKAKSQGLDHHRDDYMQLAKLQAAADKYKDASATIQEGLDKGALKPSFDVYKLQGDVCTQGEDDKCAIDAYTKASPQAKDGNIDYQLGYLLFYSDRSKDAAEALSRAIQKGGLRQEGEAYLLRGDAENDLNQVAGCNGGLDEGVWLSEHEDDGRAAPQGGKGRREDQACGKGEAETPRLSRLRYERLRFGIRSRRLVRWGCAVVPCAALRRPPEFRLRLANAVTPLKRTQFWSTLMADTYQSGGDTFSWRRVTALSFAFALHAFAFAMLLAPVAPPPPKDKNRTRR